MPQTRFEYKNQSVHIEHRRPSLSDTVAGNIHDGLRIAQTQLLLSIKHLSVAMVGCGLGGPASLGHDFRQLLRISFKLPAPTAPDAKTTYIDALRRIMGCVHLIYMAACDDVIEIQELREDVPAGAQGLVENTGSEAIAKLFRSHKHDFAEAKPLVSPLQLSLDMSARNTAWYWIHEASHKFALTDDVGSGGDTAYFDASDRCAHWRNLQQVAASLVALERGASTAAEAIRTVPMQAAIEEKFQSMVQQDRFLRVIHAVSMEDLLDNADSYSHFTMFQKVGSV